ncbi:MAG: hypothetical protein LBS51_03400 [Oscillospiraceae bacterium]|jgi:chromosome segregation ATPase|nr:hypothetical protein [Oscillospiraceae bacterium]
MTGEIKRFKREVFGGFNRDDVIAYIRELSVERDKYKSEAARLESELRSIDAEASGLRSEIRTLENRASSLREEIREAQRRARETVDGVLDGALRGLGELEETYSAVRSDVAAAVARARGELAAACDRAELLSPAFDEIFKSFNNARLAVSAEREKLSDRAGAPVGYDIPAGDGAGVDGGGEDVTESY